MTNRFNLLNISIFIGVILLLSLSITLWMNTPDLFTYFNQAFCAH